MKFYENSTGKYIVGADSVPKKLDFSPITQNLTKNTSIASGQKQSIVFPFTFPNQIVGVKTITVNRASYSGMERVNIDKNSITITYFNENFSSTISVSISVEAIGY